MTMAISPAPSAGKPSRPSASNKNPCPLCGRLKTAWSAKCSTCEGDRQRYLAAVVRQEEDRAFLEGVKGRTLQAVADEMGVSRQRIHTRIREAQQRIQFLAQNPISPVPTH